MGLSPGDKVNAEVWAYYEGGSNDNNMLGASAMVNAIASAFGGVSGAGGESGKIFDAINSSSSFLGSDTEPTLPAAYLQYIVFDTNLVPTGQKRYARVTGAGNWAQERVRLQEIVAYKSPLFQVARFNLGF